VIYPSVIEIANSEQISIARYLRCIRALKSITHTQMWLEWFSRRLEFTPMRSATIRWEENPL
jgi:hypothetical protein